MRFKKARRIMLAYLQLKIRQRDWHAVADAAMDMREMEARRQERKKK